MSRQHRIESLLGKVAIVGSFRPACQGKRFFFQNTFPETGKVQVPAPSEI